MPLIFMNNITAADLDAHTDWLFLFGDNEARRGYGGQAAVCRGKPNAVGVATKRYPGGAPRDYWTDADYDWVTAIIHHDLHRAREHVMSGGTVVCPSAGLGTGLAELPTRAPRVFEFIRSSIRHLCAMRAS
jgi:hypothetical protein